jgi:two-component system phosphate regulon sensor histidine kinase PhoR
MGGYGLGLSIAKLIIEQHGGEMSFESVIDKGTTFSFTAPLA